MKLETIKKRLEQKGIETNYRTYGESSYFFNVMGYTYEALHVELISKNIKEVTANYNAITKYCKRYNLDIFKSGRYSCDNAENYKLFLAIRTAEQKAESENYYYFRDKSIEECEQLIHEYHTAGLYKAMHSMLNKQLKEIMDYYGSLYNQSLIKAVAV